MQPLLASLVFLAVVALTIARPRGLPEWIAALGGAAVALLLGVVGPGEAIDAVAANANVLAFFVGMTGLAAVAERSGLFERAADLALQLSRRSGRRLLLTILGLGTLISAVLSNDATALILTPVIYGLVVGLGLDALPYVLACTFIADAASLILPVSNPVNLLVLDGLQLPFADYLRAIEPAALASAGLTILALYWLFRRRVPATLRDEPLVPVLHPNPRVWAGLGIIAIAFVGGASRSLVGGAGPPGARDRGACRGDRRVAGDRGCASARWSDGARSRKPGARFAFRGRSRALSGPRGSDTRLVVAAAGAKRAAGLTRRV